MSTMYQAIHNDHADTHMVLVPHTNIIFYNTHAMLQTIKQQFAGHVGRVVTRGYLWWGGGGGGGQL